MLGPKHLKNTLSNDITTLGGITLASSTTVTNLGVIFNQDLSFNSHIKQISRTAFFHLCNIAKIRHILSQKDAEKLVHAFVTATLDYCNLLLSGCPRPGLGQKFSPGLFGPDRPTTIHAQILCQLALMYI